MKKIISLLPGMVLVLAAGLAYAEDSVYTGTDDRNDKMIRNEDLSHIQLDPDRATLNQMPAESEVEGVAAGGVAADMDSMGAEVDQGKARAEKGPAESGVEGQGARDNAKDSDKWQQDMTEGESSMDKGSEGSGAGGTGEGGAKRDSDTYKY